jgi:hypothetical protein
MPGPALLALILVKVALEFAIASFGLLKSNELIRRTDSVIQVLLLPRCLIEGNARPRA